MKWMWRCLGLLVAVIALVVVWGALLPVEHSSTVARTYTATQERVWGLITSAEDFPRWRLDIESVDVRERDTTGRPFAWTEQSEFGPIPIRITQRQSPDKLVCVIDTDDLPFAGTWTYRIEDLGDGTLRVSITEDGAVKNVVFRFMSRYVFGHDTTLKAYHDHLGAELAR